MEVVSPLPYEITQSKNPLISNLECQERIKKSVSKIADYMYATVNRQAKIQRHHVRTEPSNWRRKTRGWR